MSLRVLFPTNLFLLPDSEQTLAKTLNARG
jgi:hypothetical protein